jgi:hypothetical protein
MFFIITKVFKNLTGHDMTSIDACTGRKAGLRIHHQTFPRVRRSAWLKCWKNTFQAALRASRQRPVWFGTIPIFLPAASSPLWLQRRRGVGRLLTHGPSPLVASKEPRSRGAVTISATIIGTRKGQQQN